MREKLLKLMKSQKLTSSRLAEILEIQPSSISHILSGRNKPSFDFLVKILRRFPTINPDWLLLDAEQMYRTNDEFDRQTAQPQSSSVKPQNGAVNSTTDSAATNDQPSRSDNIDSTKRTIESVSNLSKPGTEIERIIVLYSDKSFEAFYNK